MESDLIMKQQFLEIQQSEEQIKKKSVKSEQINKAEKPLKFWLLYPCLGALFLGLANFFVAIVMRKISETRY